MSTLDGLVRKNRDRVSMGLATPEEVQAPGTTIEDPGRATKRTSSTTGGSSRSGFTRPACYACSGIAATTSRPGSARRSPASIRRPGSSPPPVGRSTASAAGARGSRRPTMLRRSVTRSSGGAGEGAGATGVKSDVRCEVPVGRASQVRVGCCSPWSVDSVGGGGIGVERKCARAMVIIFKYE